MAVRRPGVPPAAGGRHGSPDLAGAVPGQAPGDGTDADGHVLSELGFVVERTASGLEGSAEVREPMAVPGNGALRLSIVAAWADIVAGLLAVDVLAPSVPVTMELDVHLAEQAPRNGRLRVAGTVLRRGGRVVAVRVEMADGAGRPIGVGGASFTAAPDRRLRLPATVSLGPRPASTPLAVPFATRAGCQRLGPGRARQVLRSDGRNASRTLNGGLIALAAEEAVLGLAPGASLVSLALRYLHPVRVGPLDAVARRRGPLAEVDLLDLGADGRLAAAAVCRLA